MHYQKKKKYRVPAIVARRLPIEFPDDPDVHPDLLDIGGLVTSMRKFVEPSKGNGKKNSYDRMRPLWFGVGSRSSMRYTAAKGGNDLSVEVESPKAHFIARAVYLKKRTHDAFYKNACNGFNWPVLHLNKEGIFYGSGYYPDPKISEKDFQCYRLVNSIFSDAVADEVIHNERPVFSHDYHFTIFPRMLKKHKPDAIIGHFMHTPFCNPDLPEVREIINNNRPVFEEMVRSLTYPDLLGFHTERYVHDFAKTVEFLFPKASINERGDFVHISVDEGVGAKVGAFPIGMNVPKIERGAKGGETHIGKELLKKIRYAEKKGAEVIVDLGRFDYEKGGQQMRWIVDSLLERGNRILYVDIAQASRLDSPGYKEYNYLIENETKRLNTKWRGELGYEPILLEGGIRYPGNIEVMKRHVTASPSLADGMCLVVPESILAKGSAVKKNPVIIGDNLGASERLSMFSEKDGIIRIDPLDTGESAEKIEKYLFKERVKLDEKVINWTRENFDIEKWREKFMTELLE